MRRKIKQLFITVLSIVLFILCLSVSASAAKYTVGTVSDLKATQTTNTITLSWKKAKNATGYRIMEKVSGKWKIRVTTTSTACILTELSPATKHTYSVRAYNDKKSDSTLWSSASKKITTLTKPKKASMLKATSIQKTSVSLSWKKAKGATGYVVYKYDSANNKWIKLKKTSSLKAKIKNLTEGTQYIFAVRSYYKNGNKTVYSDVYAKHTVTTKAEPKASHPVQLIVNSIAYGNGVIYIEINPSNWNSDFVAATDNITVKVNDVTQKITVPCSVPSSKTGYNYEIKIDTSRLNVPSSSTIDFTIPTGIIKSQDGTQYNLSYSTSIISE